jgi:gliding motility-associated-like protein
MFLKKIIYTYFLFLITAVCTPAICISQLTVTGSITAEQLAQTLTGTGVQVFNVNFTGNIAMAGTFVNGEARSFDIDSGIVLTTGRATTGRGETGLTSRNAATAFDMLASNGRGLPGDADLANEIRTNITDVNDACVLEFDFIPVGDTISFRYVFSSEEYSPSFVCSFNDAFAFFISGPEIVGLQNMALVPGTSTPVSIINVNNVPGVSCNSNTQYYVNNVTNQYFTHDGHTTILRATFPVKKCETYHLKLVIADVVDDLYDSGVFLEAKSLSSANISLGTNTKTDATGNAYLAEGCGTKKLTIRQPVPLTEPVSVVLQYSGTAINGTDIQLLPAQVTIPAGDTAVQIDLTPVADNINEGIETLKITALYNCNNNSLIKNDSIEIQVRDYDLLNLSPDTAALCNNETVRLIADAGYTTYQWNNSTTLSNAAINNPVANPADDVTTYLCIAETATCRAADSVLVLRKKPAILSQTNVTCSNGTNGNIITSAVTGFQYPVEFAINNNPFGADSNFTMLTKGIYVVKIRDAAGCTDSITVALNQKNPDPQITNLSVSAATCSGLPDGVATIAVTGGAIPLSISLNNSSFAIKDSFNLFAGNYTVYLKDADGCEGLSRNFIIPFENVLRVNTLTDTAVCEGQSVLLTTASDADSYSWQPSQWLDDSRIKNPVASPVSSVTYVVTASKGICTGKDSILITVNKAPAANAGADITICYNSPATLNGSGGISYQWQQPTLLNDQNINNPVTDTLIANTFFSLLLTDAKGCTSLVADSVLVTVSPPALIFPGNDTIVAINQPLQLLAKDINNSGFSTYVWSPVEGLSDPFVANPIAKLTRSNIIYTVTAQTPEGCSSSASLKVKTYAGPEIYVAGAFTPNNDQLNNQLHITTAGIKTLRYFTVYNRWGQIVFSSSNNNYPVWDGILKGKPVPPGTYIWVAEAVAYRGNVIQRKGTITVLY